MLMNIVTERDPLIRLRLARIESLVTETTILLSTDKTLHQHPKLPLWTIVFLQVVFPESFLLNLNMMFHLGVLLGQTLKRDIFCWRDSLLILFEVLIILSNFRIVLI